MHRGCCCNEARCMGPTGRLWLALSHLGRSTFGASCPPAGPQQCRCRCSCAAWNRTKVCRHESNKQVHVDAVAPVRPAAKECSAQCSHEVREMRCHVFRTCNISAQTQRQLERPLAPTMLHYCCAFRAATRRTQCPISPQGRRSPAHVAAPAVIPHAEQHHILQLHPGAHPPLHAALQVSGKG